MMQKNKNHKESLILLEANMANTLILQGLESLRKANNFELGVYYQSFFLLSTGIERILKLILIYDHRKQNNGEFPSNKKLRDAGHNIKKLIEEYDSKILDTYIYNIVIEFITEFAKNTRYYNLDIITGEEHDADPIAIWNVIEGIILKTYKAKVPVIQNEQILQNKVNQVGDVHIELCDGTIVNNIEPIIFEMETKDIVQGYNVLVFYEIIRNLVNVLVDYQGNSTYPDMREIFKTFLSNYTKYEIRNKKKWKRKR